MRFAFGILIILIASTPTLAIADAILIEQIVVIAALAALVAASLDARAADVIQIANIMRPLKWILILPVIWIVFQAMPMPFAKLSHSVWASAATALQQSMLGHVSIDPGKTVGALLGYLSGIVLLLLTVLLTRDRKRAEQCLFALGIVATLTALILLVVYLVQFSALAGIFATTPDTLAAISSLGLVLDVAAGVRVIERFESRLGEADAPNGPPVLNLILCAIGAVICLLAFFSVATVNLVIVVGYGVAAFALIQTIRRFDLPPWAVGGLSATAVMAGTMIGAWRYDSNAATSFLLQFSGVPGDAMVTTGRMIADATWLGSGAGTFAALLPVYQDANSAIQNAPTTAAALAVECGRPALVVIASVAVWLVIVLFRAAVARGRDSFYPTAAAACTVILLGQCFCNASLMQSAVTLLAEVVIGLGLAQSISSAGTG